MVTLTNYGHTMPTRKPRTNITLDEDINEFIDEHKAAINGK